jgi:hypothetical protein
MDGGNKIHTEIWRVNCWRMQQMGRLHMNDFRKVLFLLCKEGFLLYAVLFGMYSVWYLMI